MNHLTQVPISSLSSDRFAEILEEDGYERFLKATAQARELLRERVVWNVNSTARGGGVAELLRSLLAYARGAGVDARWLVVSGTPEFFTVTKRIHNLLHGAPGDGGKLAGSEIEIYQRVLDGNARELTELVRPEDVVILHDPQTAGLCEPMVEAGATVIWRCHVGLDLPTDLARQAWDFLRPMVRHAHGLVFSRAAFAWEGLDPSKIVVIPPSIDAFSPKNQDLDAATVDSILAAAGLIDMDPPGAPSFLRLDGAPAHVTRRVVLADGGPPPPRPVPLVVQVSRWDRLKDPIGVMESFADYVAGAGGAHLVLAGPEVEAVADDPEAAEVLAEARKRWLELDPEVRARIHLGLLPMEDGEENAAIVNALQRRASVIVQKSIAEGFGLTVAEAMWKARPVVASRVGGIQEQIVHGETGVLIEDPRDLRVFGDAVRGLLEDPDGAGEMGKRARQRVRSEFLGPRHLMQYVDLIGNLLTD